MSFGRQRGPSPVPLGAPHRLWCEGGWCPEVKQTETWPYWLQSLDSDGVTNAVQDPFTRRPVQCAVDCRTFFLYRYCSRVSAFSNTFQTQARRCSSRRVFKVIWVWCWTENGFLPQSIENLQHPYLLLSLDCMKTPPSPNWKKSPLRTGFKLQIQLCCGVYMLYITLPFSVSVCLCHYYGTCYWWGTEADVWVWSVTSSPCWMDPLLWSLHSSVEQQTWLEPVISWYNKNKLDEVHIWQFFFSHGSCIFVFQIM